MMAMIPNAFSEFQTSLMNQLRNKTRTSTSRCFVFRTHSDRLINVVNTRQLVRHNHFWQLKVRQFK